MTPGSVAMLLGETTGLRVQTIAPSLGAANVRIQGLRGRYAQLLADGLPLYGAGGDSLNLLQVPPLDLGQVEVIKGAASALYGPAALGGIINLVSRRPRGGRDRGPAQRDVAAGCRRHLLARPRRPADGRSWTLLTGFHGQRRQDLDDDGWSDSAGLRARRGPAAHPLRVRQRRRAVRHRRGHRRAARAAAPNGAPSRRTARPFAQDLRHVPRRRRRRRSLGVRPRLFAVARPTPATASARTFGDDRRARHPSHRVRRGHPDRRRPARHTLVVGAALQQDRFSVARPAPLRLHLHRAGGLRAGRGGAGRGMRRSRPARASTSTASTARWSARACRRC